MLPDINAFMAVKSEQRPRIKINVIATATATAVTATMRTIKEAANQVRFVLFLIWSDVCCFCLVMLMLIIRVMMLGKGIVTKAGCT